MSVVPDELEILLGDVRKTISDNKQFLMSLGEEQSPEDDDKDDDTDSPPDTEEDFEEL